MATVRHSLAVFFNTGFTESSESPTDSIHFLFQGLILYLD